MSEEYDIKKSIEKIGYLYSVLKDAHGNVIDGDHRLIEDPEWPTKTLEHIKDPVQLVIARLIANICRRTVPAEEKTKWVRQIAELTEWTPKQIAENLPVSYSWVMKYLPSEYKREYPESTQRVDIQKRVKPLVECGRCHLATREAEEYKGEMLCPRCLELAKHKPVTPVQTQVEPKVTTTIYKPKERWKDRVARMHPQVSKMEQAVLVKLAEKGLHPESQREFCLLSIRPDFYFPKLNKAVFLDGSVHKGREDRDERLRELLFKRKGIKSVGIAYEGTSQQAQDEIVNRIVEATKKREMAETVL